MPDPCFNRHSVHFHRHARRIFASSFSAGPPGCRSAIHCRWNVIATQLIRLVPFQALCIIPVAEEQSRTRGGPRGSTSCRGLWHSSSLSARSLSRSSSSPPPSFTQSPSPPRSLVRDGQTSPLRHRLVVFRSTCPPLSPFPHANSFVIGPAAINTHTHRHTQTHTPGAITSRSPSPPARLQMGPQGPGVRVGSSRTGQS